MKTLVLAADDIRAIVRSVGLDRMMDRTIEALEQTLADGAEGRYQSPTRDGFDYTDPDPGLIEWMPVIDEGRSATIKLVGYHPDNPDKHQLPTILSTTLNVDVGTGHIVSVVDGTFATALRTGAASAVASRTLAQPLSSTLGLIGCGAQAVTQLHALSRVFPLRSVLIYDTDASASATFAQRLRFIGLDKRLNIEICDPDEIVRRSDIVCTQTSVAVGSTPVVNDVETQAHLHINAVGSDFAGKLELPRTLLERSLVCPDFTAQAIREGECQQLTGDSIGPDMVELVRRREHFAAYQGTTTVFDSTGWALEDHVVNGVIVEYARSLGLGQELQIETVTHDPLNPYTGMLALSELEQLDAATKTG